MGMTNAKQELWAKNIVSLLKTKLVAEAICNPNVVTNPKTAKFHIVGAGEVSAGAYDEDADITYAEPSDTDIEFTWNVDQYFGILVKDTDTLQTEINWESIYADRGAYACMKALDASVFADHASAGLDSFETGSTPWQLGTAGADVPGFLAALNKQLDDADVADEGRFLVLPSIGIQALRLYFASRATPFGDVVVQNGFVGNAMGFGVYKSNNLTTANSVVHGLCGAKQDSIAWKVQVDPNSIEQLRSQGRFANLIRGRVRAGHKVYRSAALIDVNLNTTLLA